MTDDIVWIDPPKQESGRYRKIANKLIANPGKWARVSQGVTYRQGTSARVSLKAIDANIKVTQRLVHGKTGDTDAEYDVYAAYDPAGAL